MGKEKARGGKKEKQIVYERFERPPFLLLSDVTRRLRNLKPLHSEAYIVGGIVTEGYTWRDIDLVITDWRDRRALKKVLGPLWERVDCMLQNDEPPAPFFIKITGQETRSAEPYWIINPRAKKVPTWEYAGPDLYEDGILAKKSFKRETLRDLHGIKGRRKNKSGFFKRRSCSRRSRSVS